MIEVTHAWCPESGAVEGADNSTHHLVSRSAPGGGRRMVCRYCGVPEVKLRAELEGSLKGQ